MNHLYEIANGRLVSSTSLPIPSPPGGMAVVTLPDGDEVGIWNTSTLVFDPQSANMRRTKLEFLELFTDIELEDIIAKSKENTTAGHKVGVFIKKLDLAENIDLDDTRMITAVNGMESLGLIAQGRAAVILNG